MPFLAKISQSAIVDTFNGAGGECCQNVNDGKGILRLKIEDKSVGFPIRSQVCETFSCIHEVALCHCGSQK